MALKKGVAVKSAEGKLGILLPGMGAVATTFIAGVQAIRRGLGKPIGSLTQMGHIRIGKRTNTQDGSVLHVTRGVSGCYVGDNVTVGHKALLHACTIEDNAFIGMGAIILDEAVVESGAMVAAGATRIGASAGVRIVQESRGEKPVAPRHGSGQAAGKGY